MHRPFFVLNEIMIIHKYLFQKYLRNYFFTKGKIEIDSDYFINKIKEACVSDNNNNFKTNIEGEMTPFGHFIQDKKFLEIVPQFVKHVNQYHKFVPYGLGNAWGFELKPNQKTRFHDHYSALWSGVIYLNDCTQELQFPEIGECLKPEKGSFALFNGFLAHGCETNTDKVSKFGLSFNMHEVEPIVK